MAMLVNCSHAIVRASLQSYAPERRKRMNMLLHPPKP